MVADLRIADFNIGDRESCFIIAEVGVNHNGQLDIAKRLVDYAFQSGANAVKFQTFKADSLVTPNAPKAQYQIETTGSDEKQIDMIRKLELSEENHLILKEYCEQKGILFMSSPFDEASADLLEKLNVEVYKIPSGEITNIPFIAHVASKGKPMIVSTGMSSLGEVELAVRTIQDSGNAPIALLQCVSNYPAEPIDVNLAAMKTMSDAFGVPVGYSDHTLGIEVALAAAALGASIIEKHLTFDKNAIGPDHRASIEPTQFKRMVEGIRVIEAAIGNGRKIPAVSEANTAAVARKSLVAAQNIPSGTLLTPSLVAIKRPGTGLPPKMRDYLMGRRTAKDIGAGDLITFESVS